MAAKARAPFVVPELVATPLASRGMTSSPGCNPHAPALQAKTLAEFEDCSSGAQGNLGDAQCCACGEGEEPCFSDIRDNMLYWSELLSARVARRSECECVHGHMGTG